MSQHAKPPIDLIRSSLLDDERVAHAFTTRTGGVSPVPWDSLNMSWARPDDPDNVRENRARVCRELGISLDRVVQAGQIRASDVRAIGEAEIGCGAADRVSLLPPSDALITATPGVCLLACFADCVPLLFYDPYRAAVGVAHAGWRGTVGGIAAATVHALRQHYGSRPSDIRAVIGPSIGPCCYEVGPDVVAAARDALPAAARAIRPARDGHAYLDLWQANLDLLLAAGVLPEHVEITGLCTRHHADRFFSHRASAGNTGRFAALIGLRAPAEFTAASEG